jgi:hypothetical protein
MMPVDDESSTGFSLRRWSRRKLAAAREAAPATEPSLAPAPPADPTRPAVAGSIEASAAHAAAASPAEAPGRATRGAAAEPLPPVESLSFDSDFRPYLQPKVDESLRRQALRRLFEDPHFNVMDGLDIYVGDYSQPDPIPPEMLRQIVHARALLEPVTTRINAKGEVEMVVPDTAPLRAEDAADGGDAAPAVPAAAAEVPAAAAADEPASAGLPVPHAATPWPDATPDPRDDAVPVAQRDDNSPRR